MHLTFQHNHVCADLSIIGVGSRSNLPMSDRFALHVRSMCCAGVELKNVKMSMNPFCENAMEEAVKLKVGKLQGRRRTNGSRKMLLA